MAHSHHHHREHQVSHRRVAKILEHEPHGAKEHSHSHAFSKVTSKTAAEHHDIKHHGHKGPKRYARGGKVKKDDGGSVGPNQQQNQAGPSPKGLMDYGNEPVSGQLAQQGHKRGGGVKAFAKGGKVKHGGHEKGHQTNIAIVMPHPKAGAASPAGPMAGAPMAGPPPGPMGAPGPGGPGGPGGPPGMPPGGPGGMPMIPHKRGGKVIDGESTKENIKKWGKRAESNSYFRGGAATGVGREEKAHRARKGK